MKPGETEEFAARWTAAQPTLAAFVRTLVPDFHQSEEILQRVAVALVRKFDRYDRNRPFVAWAIGVAKYEVLYYRRERATDKHLFDDELLEQIADNYQRLADELEPVRDALAQCLERLKGPARRVIELRYAKDLRTAALARELGISSGAARMLLHRARALLRDCISRRLGRLHG